MPIAWTRFEQAPRDSAERRLLVAGFVDALGTGLLLPLSVIYLTRIVGLSAPQVGGGLTVAGCIGVAVTPFSGVLLDRWDARVIVVACFALSAVGFLAYIAVSSFASFLVAATAVQVASRVERPATALLVLRVRSGSDQVLGLAWQQTVRNLGYGVGGLLAALALLIHGRGPFDAVLAVNATSYVIAGWLVLQLPAVPAIAATAGATSGTYRDVFHDRTFVGLASLNVLVALHDSMLRVAMPLWIITRTHAPSALTGLLFALNTLLVVIGQVRASREVAARRAIDHSYLAAAASLSLCGGAFALAAGAPPAIAIALLVLALAALTLAELENTAGEAFLSLELAPAALRGRYISLFKSSMALQQALGPALVTLVLVHWGRLGWLALAVIAATGALASRHLGTRELARRTAPRPRPAGDMPAVDCAQ
jgi:MFS family permease